jgi:hypothetical protein
MSTSKLGLVTVAAALRVMKGLGCSHETVSQFELYVMDPPRSPLLGKKEAKARFIAGPDHVTPLPLRPLSIEFVMSPAMLAARSFKVRKEVMASFHGRKFKLQMEGFSDFYLSKVRKRKLVNH